MTPEVERRLAAILSADVVGYSRLMAEDEEATVRTLTDYREAIFMLVRQHRGRVVDSPGDNLLAEFPTATDAVECAAEIQRVMTARNAAIPPDRQMQYRVGIHLGEVRIEEDRLYGDGVNIAARLEGIADAGGICISGAVFDQVERRLDLAFEDLGEQTLRNVPKVVRAFRVRTRAAAAAPEEALPGLKELTVPGFSGRPAIAVLPFDNLSGDPEQEYFADGIAEDLITRLSGWRSFPVIARNSSFIYKGQAVELKRVSRELGVRYVVEGSVRKAGDRLRISAQLIDATTGHHVWAERYDRELTDIFALQDEITEAIVASMHPELLRFEGERAARREPLSLNAWECAQRAWWHFDKLTREENAKARELFERSLELDPSLVQALHGIVRSHVFALAYQWADAPAHALSEVVQAAEKSVAADDKDPLAHVSQGLAYLLIGQADRAAASLERALDLNPSHPLAWFVLGTALNASGRPDEGISKIEAAIRLSPRDPLMWGFLSMLAFCHFGAERYEDAASGAQRAIHRRPDWISSHAILASSLAHLGRIDEARAALREVLHLQPAYSGERLGALLAVAHPHFAERYLEGLRKAGLKE